MTWTDIADMRRGLAMMLQMNCHFAWQIGDGSYRPCRDVGQIERFAEDIFAGTKTAGCYAIRPDHQTRWGAIDCDAHGSVANQHWRDGAQRAFDTLAPKFAETWLLESSPGNFHVLTFLPELVPARDVRLMLRECAPAGVEIFPKQDTLRADDPKAKGSLLRFPGKHQQKGTWARFIARHGCVAEPERGVTAAKATSGTWEAPSSEGRLRSLYARATRGIIITGPGQRYRAMQGLAGRLKGRATEDESLWVYTGWHRHYQHLIQTPLEQSRAAFLACFRAYAPCNVEIPDFPLTDLETVVLASLPKMPNLRPEQLAESLRVCFNAQKHSAARGVTDSFFLSSRKLADKLGVSVPTAYNYLSALRRLKILTLVKRGHTGTANIYKIEDLNPFCPSENGFKSGGEDCY